MIEVFVESIRVNMTNYKRVVMLKEKTGDRYLPVGIGHFEADAIAIPMQNVPVNRPLTHDLLVHTIQQLGGRCIRAAISRLENQTFYATLVVEQDDRQVEIDCRPSDAISTAVRTEVPILVEDAVMDQAAMTSEAVAASPGNASREARAGAGAGQADDPAVEEVEAAPYLPSAEPAGGDPPDPFAPMGPVTRPVLAALNGTLNDARRAWRTAIGPGDLMLGLLREGRAASNRVLADLSVERDELQRLIEQEIERDHPTVTLTPSAQAVTRRAVEEARRLEESTVGAEHLLLALAGEPGSSVAVSLDKLGVSVDGIRRQVAVLLTPAPTEDEPS